MLTVEASTGNMQFDCECTKVGQVVWAHRRKGSSTHHPYRLGTKRNHLQDKLTPFVVSLRLYSTQRSSTTRLEAFPVWFQLQGSPVPTFSFLAVLSLLTRASHSDPLVSRTCQNHSSFQSFHTSRPVRIVHNLPL